MDVPIKLGLVTVAGRTVSLTATPRIDLALDSRRGALVSAMSSATHPVILNCNWKD